MGALTNKVIEFSYRPWEGAANTQRDLSNITKKVMRVETSKIRKVRFLPINYWITDQRRFLKTNTIELVHNKYNNIKTTIISKLSRYNISIQYLINIRASCVYNNIRLDNKVLFSSKKISMSKNVIYNDLFLITDNQSTINKTNIDLKIKDNVIILTNTRIELPDLTNYIQNNNELHAYSSFSQFSSYITKTELPYSARSILFSFFYGFIGSLSNTSILVSYFTKTVPSFVTSYYQLKPFYIGNNISYPKNKIQKSFVLNSYKTFNIFHDAFLSSNINVNSIYNIDYNQQNSFDYFMNKRLGCNFFNRLLYLSHLYKN